jgi:hypothetical protein
MKRELLKELRIFLMISAVVTPIEDRCDAPFVSSATIERFSPRRTPEVFGEPQ